MDKFKSMHWFVGLVGAFAIIALLWAMATEIMELNEVEDKCNSLGYDDFVDRSGFGESSKWYCYRETNGFAEYSPEIYVS